MKQEPMFSIEMDHAEGLRIVITRPNGTPIVITGGQSRQRSSRPEPQLANFLGRNPPQAH